MMQEFKQDAINQLEAVHTAYSDLLEHTTRQRKRNSEYRPSFRSLHRIVIQGLAAIERIAGNDSIYYKQAELPPETKFNSLNYREAMRVESVIAAVYSLRSDVHHGFMRNVETRVRNAVFSDFLEEAKHFLDSGNKDYAAVIVGISLESHLRQLCLNRDMETEREAKSTTRQLKADTLNTNLAKAQVYAINDQKSVTAWLGLRNSAVHSNFDEYSNQQVALMIGGVRDFIARNPE